MPSVKLWYAYKGRFDKWTCNNNVQLTPHDYIYIYYLHTTQHIEIIYIGNDDGTCSVIHAGLY